MKVVSYKKTHVDIVCRNASNGSNHYLSYNKVRQYQLNSKTMSYSHCFGAVLR